MPGEQRALWVAELEHTWVYLIHRSFSWAVLIMGLWFTRSARRVLGRQGWLETGIMALIVAQMLLGVLLAHVGIIAVVQILHIGLSSLLVSGLFLWLLGSRSPAVIESGAIRSVV